MSIWAEERRQGTDELLLTVPANDIDIVLGKFLAGVAIFTVSLLFSAFSIMVVFLYGLGNPDPGLYVSTFIGYWFIGIAMISVGMVASFLTDNLTVGFILGTLFNLPLAIFGVADWVFKDFPKIADALRQWSAIEQFKDFERGVLSIGGVVYFLSIAAVMIYLSMVLIGRRHWRAGEETSGMAGHFLVRTLCLGAAAIGITMFVQEHNFARIDATSEDLNSLSADTVRLISELRDNDEVSKIKIDAYISPDVPDEYATTKRNLLTTLEELRALGEGKISVVLHRIPNFGPDAEKAEKNFGITPQEYTPPEGGESQDFFLGVGFTSGLDKVTVPFVNTGIPVEYELVRSILTVAQSERKVLGIVDTDLPFMDIDLNEGGRGRYALIEELDKQYELKPVDPSKPIVGKYDCLLALQPSMLGPAEMDNFIDAIRSGIPTAIFEDPFPFFFPGQMVPGTGEPRVSGGMGMMGMGGGQPIPKGDIDQLWQLLEVSFNPASVVWQNYRPDFTAWGIQTLGWVFIDEGNDTVEPFNDDNDITSGLNQVMLLYPGSIRQDEEAGNGTSELKFEPLATTSAKLSGTTPVRGKQRGDQEPWRDTSELGPANTYAYIVAAQISGKPAEKEAVLEEEFTDETDPADREEESEEEEEKEINVVVVADIDLTLPDFFDIRARGLENFLPSTQNVTLMLNVLDQLAGDDRFINIRKRTRPLKRLTDIENATMEYMVKAEKTQKDFNEDLDEQDEAAQKAFQEQVDKI
ncbi:MAG: Gldg family protein, partial [Lacipirellulaceae bacterium]